MNIIRRCIFLCVQILTLSTVASIGRSSPKCHGIKFLNLQGEIALTYADSPGNEKKNPASVRAGPMRMCKRILTKLTNPWGGGGKSGYLLHD